MNQKSCFTWLDPNNKLFTELLNKPPKWWKMFCNDNDLYIEIRKKNYINVYYYGGAVAKITYDNGFIVETHQKYLGDYIPRGIDKKDRDIYGYDEVDLSSFDEILLSEMKKRVNSDYLKQPEDVNKSEKRVQGKMIKINENYIDSEFQYNEDPEINKLRIDLIELSNGVLTFVELKLISDGRMLHSAKNDKTPKVIEQMDKYSKFIIKYEAELINYYKKLLALKISLEITKIKNTNIIVNKTPKLLIANIYEKASTKRDNRMVGIKKLLQLKQIDFKITCEKSKIPWH